MDPLLADMKDTEILYVMLRKLIYFNFALVLIKIYLMFQNRYTN